MKRVFPPLLPTLCLFIFLIFGFQGTANSLSKSNVTISNCAAQDSLVLVDLYQATRGENWIINWDLTQSMSSWHGIKLTSEGCVFNIDLARNNLTGTLPESFGNLSELRYLSMNQNRISGFIPRSVENLSNLFILNLSGNSFNGTIDWNWGNMPALIQVQLYNNRLSGSIPESLFTLENLERLGLSQNQLTGILSVQLGKLKKIKSIYLNNNLLSGPLPFTIGELKDLTQLHLQSNNFSGSIPSSIGDLISLEQLKLDHNNLEGIITRTITQLENLTVLSLAHNQLSGSIPTSINNLEKLRELNLSYNQLYGSIPSSLYNTNSLSYINIEHNQFRGNISLSIVQLQQLSSLDISNNNFSGNIPEQVGNLTRLRRLDLSHNDLVGSIPDEIGLLNNLLFIDLSNNQLSGCFDADLSNICDVNTYNFSNNQFTGTFENFCQYGANACEYSSCRENDSLILIKIHEENGGTSWINSWDLSEPIDTWFGIELNEGGCVASLILRNNNLIGELSNQIYLFSALKQLDLGENRLTGSLSDEIDQLNLLETLKLDNNLLSGTLPISLAVLIHLTEIDLSNNNIEGCYPSNFSAICEIDYNFSGNDLLEEGITFEQFCAGESSSGCFESLSCPELDVSVTDATAGNSDGGIELLINRGIPPFQFNWSTGDTTQNLERVPAGIYYVSVTDASGCKVSKIGQVAKIEYQRTTIMEDVGMLKLGMLVNEFPENTIVEDVKQIGDICINIEHSYMRDLEISLTCPSGQSIILHEYPGRFNSRTVFLGEPVEDDEAFIISGEGYDYCWTQDDSLLTWIEYFSTQFTPTLPSGNYATFENFSELVGCPINGEWTLSIEDLWEQDNGTLFNWSLQLYDRNAQDSIIVGTRENGQEIAIRSEKLNSKEFEIYPNPSDGNLTFDFNLPSDAVLQILNAQGRLLEEIRVVKGIHQIQKDWSKLSKGIYYCRLQLADRVVTRRLVITQ